MKNNLRISKKKCFSFVRVKYVFLDLLVKNNYLMKSKPLQKNVCFF